MYHITSACNACGDCLDTCPVDHAIRPGTSPEPSYVISDACADCGACIHACPQGAIRFGPAPKPIIA